MTKRKLLEDFIRLPKKMTESELNEKLQGGSHIQGSIREIDLKDSDQDLIIQTAQHKAIFDKDQEKRYSLHITWDLNEDFKKVAVVMMNPSLANEKFSDPTVTFMTEYASTHFQAGSLWIVNMSPIINPKSQELTEENFVKDSENEKIIEEAITWADIVFLAWGDKGKMGVEAMRNKFKGLLYLNKEKLYCFGQSLKGQPKHRNQRPFYKLDHQPQKVNLNSIFYLS